jgi:hypothetical protein
MTAHPHNVYPRFAVPRVFSNNRSTRCQQRPSRTSILSFGRRSNTTPAPIRSFGELVAWPSRSVIDKVSLAHCEGGLTMAQNECRRAPHLRRKIEKRAKAIPVFLPELVHLAAGSEPDARIRPTLRGGALAQRQSISILWRAHRDIVLCACFPGVSLR